MMGLAQGSIQASTRCVAAGASAPQWWQVQVDSNGGRRKWIAMAAGATDSQMASRTMAMTWDSLVITPLLITCLPSGEGGSKRRS